VTASAAGPLVFSALSETRPQTWRRPDTFAFIDRIAQVPLSDSEILLCSHHLPIAITYLSEGPRVVAITDAQFQRTAVVAANGNWQRPYMPVALKCLPFRLSPGSDGKLAVEIAGKICEAEQGTLPTHREDGSLTPEIKNIVAVLHRLEEGKRALRKAAEMLLIADVLTPLRIARLAKTGTPGSGYLIVDRNKFAGLSKSRVAHLIKDSFLPIDLAAACMFSQRLMPTLVAVPGSRSDHRDHALHIGTEEFSSPLPLNLQVDRSDLFSFERFEEMTR
jgi:hypothetical protein